ncbi:DUF2058 family protein [Pseudoxanthomonas sp.]|uniref:DUF2058 family protein n=1 Tax=Pseudoxanthomonas sp. TaxID=1871049 RepID=UPI00259068E7|nr:DUF2058 family protein [Pseudoxanthomonas sp.]MCR6687602.1 DUF2058 family protein [Pseudoxanthomonas sp.]
MIDSLRDQLLNLGFKAPEPERKPAPSRDGKGGQGTHPRGPGGKGGPHGRGGEQRRGGPQGHAGAQAKGTAPARQGHPPRGGRGEGGGRPGGKPGEAGARRKPASEMDLGKAWALRANQEKQERIEAERQKQEEARQRREARARLEELLQGKALNDPAAEIARHFEYGGRIKRIYVNETQLKALNAGELGVLQLNGRYLLVDAAVLAEAEAVFPPAVALKGPSEAPAGTEPPPSRQDDPYADPRYQVPDDLVW